MTFFILLVVAGIWGVILIAGHSITAYEKSKPKPAPFDPAWDYYFSDRRIADERKSRKLLELGTAPPRKPLSPLD